MERYKYLNPAYQEILKQERLKNLVRIAQCMENSTVGIFEMNLEEKITQASLSFAELLGYDDSQVCGLSYADFCHPDDLYAYYFLKDRLLSGEIDNCYLNVRYIRQDGQILQVIQNTDLSLNDAEELYFVNKFEDITDWERTINNLRDLENRTRYLFENNPNPMWIYDLETLGFLAVNQAAISHYGYSEAEFLAMTIRDIRPPEDIPQLLAAIAAIDTGLTTPEIWRHRKKDGSLILVEVSAHTLTYEGRKCELILINDVTQKMQAEEALKLAEAKYRSIFENAIEGIFQSSLEGRFLIANPMLAQIYGYQSSQELIENLTDIQHQLYVDPHTRVELLHLLKEHGEVKQFESLVYCQNGEQIWTSENIHAIYDVAGNILYLEGTVEDITASKQAKAEIEHLAFHDSLTDLPNRLLFRDRLSNALEQASQNLKIYFDENCQGDSPRDVKTLPPMLAVMFLDLDRFKLVNDTMGHAAGDRLLIEVAKRLQECMIQDTFLARMGGDEFMIFVPDLQSVESIQQFAELILQSFEQPFFVEEMPLYIGTSIGVSLYPNDGLDEDTLMKHADTAMFRAKERGRNHYQLYNHAIGAEVMEYVAIENGIRQALDRGEFQVFYQPQINLHTGKIDCMEALARWLHPELGWVPPNQFIPAAEEHGLIVRLGEWVLRTACQQNQAWQAMGLPPIRMAVNFSAQQFQVANLCDRVMQILEDVKLAPQYLEVEITESLVMQDQTTTITMLKKLRSKGISVSIDDFGTGYSSLSYLRLLPVSKVKIDASFVRETPQNAEDSAITSAIIAMAHNLNLKAIAEGVERKEQLEFLRSHNCDAVQGYLFSRPVPFAEATLLLKARTKPASRI